jgi:hypothetical protein
MVGCTASLCFRTQSLPRSGLPRSFPRASEHWAAKPPPSQWPGLPQGHSIRGRTCPPPAPLPLHSEMAPARGACHDQGPALKATFKTFHRLRPRTSRCSTASRTTNMCLSHMLRGEGRGWATGQSHCQSPHGEVRGAETVGDKRNPWSKTLEEGPSRILFSSTVVLALELPSAPRTSRPDQLWVLVTPC